MADGSIIIDTHIDNENANKELGQLRKNIVKLNSSLNSKKTEQSAIEKEMHNADAAIEQTYQNIKKLEAELASLEGINLKDNTSAEYFAAQQRIPQIKAELAAQNAILDKQGKTADGIAAKYDKVSREVNETEAELRQATAQAGELAQKVDNVGAAAKRTGVQIKKAGKQTRNFRRRIIELTKSALIFSVVTKALTAAREWFVEVAKANNETAAAVGRLKGALRTLAAPIINSLLPVITNFINLLARLVATIASLTAVAFGSNYETAQKDAEALEKEQEALEGVGEAAEEAAKQLASFDEINKLTETSAGSTSEELDTLFDAQPFEGKLMDFLTDVAIKINEVVFDWKNGNIASSQDSWITALTGLLGMIIGGYFGGLKGAAIGLLLGIGVGIVSATFADKLKNPTQAKQLLIIALTGILGAVLGAMFGGLSGAVIGLLLGISVSIISANFKDKLGGKSKASKTFDTVLKAVLGAIIGGMFGGVKGAVVGLALGMAISFIEIEFFDSLENGAKAKSIFDTVLTTMLLTILGAHFGGLLGAAIGFLIGLAISFTSIQFNDGLTAGEKKEAASGLMKLLTTIVGAIIGLCFGGPVGALVGASIALSFANIISLISMNFEDKVANRGAAASIFRSVIFGLIGAIIGTAIGGVFGGIVGGVIGISLGLAIDIIDLDWNDKTKNEAKTTGFISGMVEIPDESSYYTYSSIPQLARGAVIPPNRKFLAVLGDQANGNNIEAPEGLIRQIVREEAGGSNAILREILAAIREGKVLMVDKKRLGEVVSQAINDKTRASGASPVNVW